MKNTPISPYLILAALAGIFFLPWLGGVHLFDWDEINFAEIAREMLISGNYTSVTIDFQPFYQKPPLFFWLQAAAMHLFGIGEYASRFPNALAGIITLPLLYHLGKKHFDSLTGWLWAGAYFGSVLPFLYFKSGIIDPVFNLFIFLGLYALIRFHWQKSGMLPGGKNNTWLLWGGLSVGLAILTKGPVAFLIIGLVLGVYWIYQRFRMYINIPEFLGFSLAAAGVTLTWFGIETLANGPEFAVEFTRYQYRLLSTPDAGHKGFPLYHAVVLLVGCFPASLFIFPSFRKSFAKELPEHQADLIRWMKILFWVVLILFSIVQSKIVHYSSLAYFPLTLLAAVVIRKIICDQSEISKGLRVGLIAIGTLYLIVITGVALLGYRGTDMLVPLISDPFAVANLAAEVRWSGWEWTPALWLLIALVIFFRFTGAGRHLAAFRWLFLSTALFTLFTLVIFIKRIEGYSQRAALEYFTQLAGEDCYLQPVGYKTYAHLFYGKTMPGKRPEARDQEWLLTSPNLDKPVYFITKTHKAKELAPYPELEKVGEKNGFVLFRRKTASKTPGKT